MGEKESRQDLATALNCMANAMQRLARAVSDESARDELKRVAANELRVALKYLGEG